MKILKSILTKKALKKVFPFLLIYFIVSITLFNYSVVKSLIITVSIFLLMFLVMILLKWKKIV